LSKPSRNPGRIDHTKLIRNIKSAIKSAKRGPLVESGIEFRAWCVFSGRAYLERFYCKELWGRRRF